MYCLVNRVCNKIKEPNGSKVVHYSDLNGDVTCVSIFPPSYTENI